MSLVFRKESIDASWDQIYNLAREHWSSTRTYRRHEPFNPSKARYLACEQSGFFHLFGARDGDLLAGYFGVYITQSMHSQLSMAVEDTLFLHPHYRGGRNAIRFVRYIEDQCLAIAGQDIEMLFSCEIDNETGIKGLLLMLDYKPVIVQYSKRLSLSTRPDRAREIPEKVSNVCSVSSSST